MTIFINNKTDGCYVAYIINGNKYKDIYVYYADESFEKGDLIYYEDWMNYADLDLESDPSLAKYFIIAAFKNIKIF